MTEQVKCCGTCKSWEERKDVEGLGNCSCPIPDTAVRTCSVWADSGKYCPCYQPKKGRT